MADAEQTKAEHRAARAKRNEERDVARAAAKAKDRADRQAEKAEEIQEKRHVRSLAEIAEASLLKDLKSSIKIQSRKATFACGGTVDFLPDSEKQTAAAEKDVSIPSIDVRFGESGNGMTLTLPAQTGDSSEFQALLKACQPASFGRGSEEVLDEDYRKAEKLDRTAFATTFCPYEAGIIDVVAQLLLSPTSKKDHKRSIKAELYKLNVYSAPSGKFKAHVDTPRSEDQIGSLVVCLPLNHEGGELSVRNSGKELTFDWSQNAADGDLPVIQWASFYSDCEHEVHEVTSGHRLTLAYNLYVTRGLGHLAESDSALDPCQLPLYQPLMNALDNPGFLRRGRVLAVWLTHSYAHTNEHVNFLPSSLKGADMAITYYEGGGDAYLAGDTFYGFNDGDGGNSNLDPSGCGEGFGDEIPAGKITCSIRLKAQEGPITKENEVVVDEAAKFKEVQMAYMTYGNSPGIGIEYSRAAMLIRIPPYLLRPEEKRPASSWSDIKDSYDEYSDYYECDSDPDSWYNDDPKADSQEGGYEDWDDDDGDSYEWDTDEEEIDGPAAGQASNASA